MNQVTVLYPNGEGARFDFDYYTRKHVPWVAGLVGQKIEVRKGLSAPGGAPAPFLCVASIHISSIEDFQAVLAQHGAQIMADIANYTNVQPLIQIDEVLMQ